MYIHNGVSVLLHKPHTINSLFFLQISYFNSLLKLYLPPRSNFFFSEHFYIFVFISFISIPVPQQFQGDCTFYCLSSSRQVVLPTDLSKEDFCNKMQTDFWMTPFVIYRDLCLFLICPFLLRIFLGFLFINFISCFATVHCFVSKQK